MEQLIAQARARAEKEMVLVKTRSRGAGLSPVLMRAMFSRFPNKVWHVPALFPEEMSAIFDEVGMKREDLSQLQMALAL